MSKKNVPESSSYFEGDIVKSLPIAKDLRPFIEAMADLIIADMIRYPNLDDLEDEAGKPRERPGAPLGSTDE